FYPQGFTRCRATHAGARYVLAACHDARWLGSKPVSLCTMRRARSAPCFSPSGRRSNMRQLPSTRSRRSRSGDATHHVASLPRVFCPSRGGSPINPCTITVAFSTQSQCLVRDGSGIAISYTIVITPDPNRVLHPPQIPADFLPEHTAMVMDGNGRWAKERGMKPTEGHK